MVLLADETTMRSDPSRLDPNSSCIVLNGRKVSNTLPKLGCREPCNTAVEALGFPKKMDKNMLGDLDSLPEEDKARMAGMIDQLQIRDSLRMYNSLVERCFSDCVDSFRRKTLDKQEESCVRRCAEKFLKQSMRVGMRFAELNTGAISPD